MKKLKKEEIPLKFELLKTFKKARASNMTLPHGMV